MLGSTTVQGCAASPCQNGVCFETLEDPILYLCLCQYGYEGYNCEINIDDCDGNQCQNGATCVDLIGGYECDCEPGYAGPLCSIGIWLFPMQIWHRLGSIR